jgi:hypothetical protein
MTHKGVPEEQQQSEGVTPGLVRLSVGCEDLDDIRADLGQALAAVDTSLALVGFGAATDCRERGLIE